VLDALQEAAGVKRIDLKQHNIEQKITTIMSESYAKKHSVMPVEYVGDKLAIAMADPIDYMTIDDVRLMIGKNLIVYIATKTEINHTIEKYYGFTKTLDALGVVPGQKEETIEIEEEDDDKNPMVELVDQILANAVNDQASDIHINPLPDMVEVKNRVDGILRDEMHLPKELAAQLTARIKVMAQMNVTENRIPQDGRIRTSVDGREIDLRISTVPTVNGEKIVMRVLDLSIGSSDFGELGFSKADRATLTDVVERPNGIILVSGPTGSGKTTTLYAVLDKINNVEDNIITVEDPVERQINGINQIQVRDEVDMTFANALRAILRQDPDTIMVGEIRDAETASIAVRAALTGHLVLSTIHTNDSIATIPRLIDMGVEHFLVSASVNCIIAQRLVRVICPECSYWDDATESEKLLFEKRGIKVDKVKRTVGCTSCNNRGYKGRTGIYEIFVVSEKVRRMISERANVNSIKNEANKEGMKYLIDDGLHKVKAGITTIEEILRVSVNPEV
jgi:type IV pilus assembly protein PilB